MKPFVVAMSVGDLGREAEGEFRHALLELVHGLLELVDVRFRVGQKGVEQFGELSLVREFDAERLAAVLVEDARLRVFKDDIREGIALGGLLRDLRVKVVLGILSLPVAARYKKLVPHGAVRYHAAPAPALGRQLRDERPMAFLGGLGQQVLESRADGGLVADALRRVVRQGLVVRFHRPMAGPDGAARPVHGLGILDLPA